MNKRVVGIFMMLALLFSVVSSVPVSATSYHEGEVEEYILKQLIAANIPGMEISIATADKEIYSAAFGDIEEPTSDVKLGAVTQSFTSLAIMQLVEDDKLSLTDTVSKYLVDYEDVADVTIEELLNQTSGIGYTQKMSKLSVTDMRGSFAQAYANYNLLGKVIESVSGSSYSAYIQKNILEPLDMKSTYVIDDAVSVSDVAPGHKSYFGLPVKSKDVSLGDGEWIGEGSGGIITDVKDMTKYMQMYLNAGGEVLSYNGVEKLMKSGTYVDGSVFGNDSSYSMGWYSTKLDDRDIYYCAGIVDDYASSVFLIPSDNVAVTMIFDAADALAGKDMISDIEAGVVNLILGQGVQVSDENEYFVPHLIADLICLAVAFVALFPLVIIEMWYKWTKKKFSALRLAADICLHLIVPTLVLVIAHVLIPLGILRILMPDFIYVLIGAAVVLYLGGIIKILLRVIIGERKPYVEDEDDIPDEDDSSILAGSDMASGTDTNIGSSEENKEYKNDASQSDDSSQSADTSENTDASEKTSEQENSGSEDKNDAEKAEEKEDTEEKSESKSEENEQNDIDTKKFKW